MHCLLPARAGELLPQISGDGNLSYTYQFKPSDVEYVQKISGLKTVTKRKSWAAGATLTTSDDLLSVSKGGEFRPGLELKLGRHMTIDSFEDAVLSNVKYSVKTYGFNGILTIDNIKLYDPLVSKAAKKYPVSAGAEGYMNFIFVNRGKLADKALRVILALNASVRHTWNDDGLISYQELSKATVAAPVVALEEFEGRYGTLNRDVWKGRLSASWPVYWNHFNPIPYIAVVAQTNGKPIYYPGIFTNYLVDKLVVKKFLLPSASFGVGIGYKYTDSKFSNTIFYVKGDLNLGKR